MPALATLNPLTLYWDKNGDPLDDGQIYFGQVNLNPLTDPITVYWDPEMTQPAAQPVRTKSGYPVRFGTPASIYVSDAYSILLKNRKDELIYYGKNSVDFGNAASIQSNIDQLSSNLASVDGPSSIGWDDNTAYSSGLGLKVRKLSTGRSLCVLDFIDPTQWADIENGVSNFDCAAAISQAITKACDNSSIHREIYFPSGKYKTFSRINVTNTRVSGSEFRDSISFVGEGVFNSVIEAAPGNDKAALDISGSQGFTIRDMQISGVSGSCGVGIFTAASNALPQSHNQRFENLWIIMPSDSTANGGNGTVAFWNYGSEENTHTSCYYKADRPAIFTASPALPFSYANPFNPLASSHSCGVNLLSRVTLVGTSATSPALYTADVNSFIYDGYLSNIEGGAGHVIQGSFLNSHLKATVEGAGSAIDLFGYIYNSDYRVLHATTINGPSIFMREGSEISNADIDVFMGQLATKLLMYAVVTSPTAPSATKMENVKFRTNLAPQYILNGDNGTTGTGLAYVLANSNNVVFEAPGYEYRCYSDRDVFRMPVKTTSATGSGAPAAIALCRVEYPPSGANNFKGLGTVLEFNGSVNSVPTSSNQFSARVIAYLGSSQNYATGTVSAYTGGGSAPYACAEVPTSLLITGASLSGAVASTEVTASLNLTRSGTDTTQVEIRGELILWKDVSTVAVATIRAI